MRSNRRYLYSVCIGLCLLTVIVGAGFYYWLYSDYRAIQSYLAALPGVMEVELHGDFQEVYWVRLHIKQHTETYVLDISPLGKLNGDGTKFSIEGINGHNFFVTGAAGIDVGPGGWFVEAWGAEYDSLRELVGDIDQFWKRAQEIRETYGEEAIYAVDDKDRKYAVRIKIEPVDS